MFCEKKINQPNAMAFENYFSCFSYLLSKCCWMFITYYLIINMWSENVSINLFSHFSHEVIVKFLRSTFTDFLIWKHVIFSQLAFICDAKALQLSNSSHSYHHITVSKLHLLKKICFRFFCEKCVGPFTNKFSKNLFHIFANSRESNTKANAFIREYWVEDFVAIDLLSMAEAQIIRIESNWIQTWNEHDFKKMNIIQPVHDWNVNFNANKIIVRLQRANMIMCIWLLDFKGEKNKIEEQRSRKQ